MRETDSMDVYLAEGEGRVTRIRLRQAAFALSASAPRGYGGQASNPPVNRFTQV